jgi:hypothetical protein
MRAEMVLNQNDLARPWEIPVCKIPKDGRVIGGGMPIGYLNVPPASKGAKERTA